MIAPKRSAPMVLNCRFTSYWLVVAPVVVVCSPELALVTSVPVISAGPSRNLTEPSRVQVISGVAGSSGVAASCAWLWQLNAENCRARAGVTQARSLPSLGLAVLVEAGQDGSSAAVEAVLVTAPVVAPDVVGVALAGVALALDVGLVVGVVAAARRLGVSAARTRDRDELVPAREVLEAPEVLDALGVPGAAPLVALPVAVLPDVGLPVEVPDPLAVGAGVATGLPSHSTARKRSCDERSRPAWCSPGSAVRGWRRRCCGRSAARPRPRSHRLRRPAGG